MKRDPVVRRVIRALDRAANIAADDAERTCREWNEGIGYDDDDITDAREVVHTRANAASGGAWGALIAARGCRTLADVLACPSAAVRTAAQLALGHDERP